MGIPNALSYKHDNVCNNGRNEAWSTTRTLISIMRRGLTLRSHIQEKLLHSNFPIIQYIL